MNVDFDNIKTEVLQQVTPGQAWHYYILPYQLTGEDFWLYIDENKMEPGVKDELELLFGKDIHLQPVEGSGIREAMSRYYRRAESGGRNINLATSVDSNFLDNLLGEARQLGSSDIHLEPYEERCRVRFRIDGQLVDRYQLEREDYPSIVNKVKIKANLDIAEKRLPQDGRIFFEEEGQKIDIRVSTLPTLHGEKIVMRLLSSNDSEIDIHGLGFKEADLQNYLEGVEKPNGMVLISGPTGSGKTTTLYATLHILNESTRNILTIEDPIEYTLEGINQVQLKEAIGLNFASAMRTFLRQDPDIIMVGEIRDFDTASMAIRASLTGHLVLSTIHTNSAWGIVARLIDMGVPSYLLADTLNTAVAQRLLRLLCPDCKTAVPLDTSIYPRSFRPPQQLEQYYQPKGCEKCYYTGFRGRTAVYEIIPIQGELAHMIKTKELNAGAVLREMGIRSLADNAFELFARGLTSIKEVYPILSSSGF
ncbi:MAG: GspE/PulE family protein [Bacteroidota bacterium]